MARSAQMADIDQYLSDTSEVQTPTVPPIDLSMASDAVGAPEIEGDTTGRQEEHAPAVMPDVEEERASIREMRQAQVEAARQREEENQTQQKARQAIEGVSDSVTQLSNTIKATAGNTGQAIARVPIPGDLLLPLSILLIFFLALIPINGHTRLMWLWLTLTGNASLTTGAGASFGAVTGQVTPVSGTVPPLSSSVQTLPGSVVSLPTLPVSLPGQLPPLSGTGLRPLSSLPVTPNILSALFTGVEDIL